jgi:hypothetical protein
MLRALSTGEPRPERVQAALAELGLREELAGHLPTGFLRRAELPRHEAVLRGWLQDVAQVAGAGPLGGRVLQFGRAIVRDGVFGAQHGPILLPTEAPDGSRLEVELVGRTELLAAPAGGAATFIFTTRSKSSDKPARRQRDRLRAFVDHLALAAAGMDAGARRLLLAIWRDADDHSIDEGRLLPVSAETARAYLGEIVREMLTGARDASGAATGVHPYLLPCEAVFDARIHGGEVVAEVEKLRDAYFEKPFLLTFSSVTGPVPEAVERHEPPTAEAAAAMVEARFGLFFELCDSEDARKRGGRK